MQSVTASYEHWQHLICKLPLRAHIGVQTESFHVSSLFTQKQVKWKYQKLWQISFLPFVSAGVSAGVSAVVSEEFLRGFLQGGSAGRFLRPCLPIGPDCTFLFLRGFCGTTF